MSPWIKVSSENTGSISLSFRFVAALSGIAALSSGESQLNWGSVSAANLGAVAEGADLVFVTGFINRLAGNVVSNPRIKSPPELKGKSIGINSLGGGAWILTMLTLDYWALYRSGIGFSSGHWVPSR
jgi:ABC-type nitrate/sulfonate/bicarbonate transport system substrate-binding protein